MSRTAMSRQPLYVTIDNNLEGVGLRISTSRYEKKEGGTEEEMLLREHNTDRISVPNDPSMAAYVIAEILREHPGYNPQIEVRGQIDREQFYRAYRRHTGQELEGVLDS